jgi:hypothetical protein
MPTKRPIATAQQAVIEWVRENALELHNECPDQPSRNRKPGGVRNFRTGTPAGIRVRLNRETVWSQGIERPKGNADADRRQEAGEGGGGEEAGGQAAAEVRLAAVGRLALRRSASRALFG